MLATCFSVNYFNSTRRAVFSFLCFLYFLCIRSHLQLFRKFKVKHNSFILCCAYVRLSETLENRNILQIEDDCFQEPNVQGFSVQNGASHSLQQQASKTISYLQCTLIFVYFTSRCSTPFRRWILSQTSCVFHCP